MRRVHLLIATALVTASFVTIAGITPAQAETFVGTITAGDPTDPSFPGLRYDAYTFTPTNTQNYGIAMESVIGPSVEVAVCVVELSYCGSSSVGFAYMLPALTAGTTYQVRAYAATGRSYTVEIEPEDPIVTIQSRTMGEFDTGDGPGQSVTVSLNVAQPADTVVHISHAAEDGNLHGTDTARGGVDYTSSASSVVIPAGQTSAVFGVRVFGDSRDELHETITFTSSAARVGTGAEFNPGASGTVTITDNDDPPNLMLTVGTVPEGNSGTTVLPITVSGNGSNPSSVQVLVDRIACEDGAAATAGSDFHELVDPAWVPIPQFTAFGTTGVGVIGDTAYEPDESICFFAVKGYSLEVAGGSFATDPPTGLPADAKPFEVLVANDGTITNDDDAPAITIVSDSVPELDASQQMAVDIAQAVAQPTTVSITIPVQDGALHGTDTARGGAAFDYTTASTIDVTIPAGQTRGVFGVRVYDDIIDELDETITFTSSSARIGDGPAFDPGASGTFTILDDDAPPSFFFDAGAATEGNSGSPGHPVDFVVGSGSPGVTYQALAATVPCGAGIEAATAGVDYQSFGPAFLTITGTFSVNIIGDTAYEPTEYVCLDGGPVYALQGPGGDFTTNPPTGLPADTVMYGDVDATDVLPIGNDDAPPAVTASISNPTVTVNEGTAATVTVRFTPATVIPTTINWQAIDGTDPIRNRAQAGQTPIADYAGGTGTLVVPAGTTTATITVATNLDTLNEGAERFQIQLTGSPTPSVTISTPSTSTVTINNAAANPPPPTPFPPTLPIPGWPFPAAPAAPAGPVARR